MIQTQGSNKLANGYQFVCVWYPTVHYSITICLSNTKRCHARASLRSGAHTVTCAAACAGCTFDEICKGKGKQKEQLGHQLSIPYLN